MWIIQKNWLVTDAYIEKKNATLQNVMFMGFFCQLYFIKLV